VEYVTVGFRSQEDFGRISEIVLDCPKNSIEDDDDADLSTEALAKAKHEYEARANIGNYFSKSSLSG
jgi:hypothetical protein